jgi:hypothetical protein
LYDQSLRSRLLLHISLTHFSCTVAAREFCPQKPGGDQA